MKKVMFGLLISAATLGLGISANAAIDEGVTVDEGTRQVTSDATITVNAGEETPTEPETPNEPSGKTDQNGPLSIDQVIVFKFKAMNLTGTTQAISLAAQQAQNIQVTDTRGTGAGWNLQIKQTPLTEVNKPTNVLKGAFITLNNGEIKAGKDIVDSTEAPVSNDYAVTAANKGNFQKIMTATSPNGKGTWRTFYNQTSMDDIQLVVPAGNLKGDYEGSVIWALSDSPTAEPAE